ncbi:MAG: aminoglycoside phosphotransferase family protein [Phycisphaerales bacterium]|nr:MAG: aminoglycoside phosphotransferase family protein [Phycisphaerales bacterium]
MGTDASAEAGHGQGHSSDGTTANGLGSSLEPTLRETSGGRLGPIEWFKAAWQRGGASTGFSTWDRGAGSGSGEAVPVLVKVPIGPVEHRWTVLLGSVEGKDYEGEAARSLPTPRVLAAGEQLGGYDLAWVVVERFAGKPLSREMSKADVLDLLETVARFHARASEAIKVTGHPAARDWSGLIERARDVAGAGTLADGTRWAGALKKAQKVVPQLHAQWEARSIDCWCHGDVHPGNAMRREAPGGAGDGCCVLIDLAETHPGHWVEDAVYLERQYWGRSELLHGVKPVSALARARKKLGLPCAEGYAELANIRRFLMACCVPAFLERDGADAVYTAAALDAVERLLPTVGKV